MRIKRIEIIGFKSFCDRMVVNIGDSITAVVGPNGCGKSNIVDAIRWCMGEQSAKHLRGKAMDDVIFAGSESRGPASMAEVSLTFDDVGFSHEALELALASPEHAAAAAAAIDVDASVEAEVEDNPEAEAAAEGQAPEGAEAAAQEAPVEPVASATADVVDFLAEKPAAIDFAEYTEVTVTRRLFRDGTSAYLINKVPCRLRDITDFFMGTGIGTKAYAIIEQGRIGMIVSSRPQERRMLVEEAAGITKFKAKKKAAERKLDKTRQNLLRVNDIVEELSKRMGSLRRQAQKAERYRKYKSEVRDIDMWKATHRYLELEAEDKVLAASLEAARAELERVRAEFDSQDAQVIAERAELGVEERRLSALQEQIYELENRIKLSESKIEYQTREASELDERVAGAHGEIRSLETRRSEASEQLESQRGELAELEGQISGQEETLSEREAAAGEARAMLQRAQSRLDEARALLSQAQADQARAESQTESLGRRREDAQRRLERVVGDTEVLNKRIKELEKESKGFDSKLAELKQTRLDLGQQTEHMAARKIELEEQCGTCEAEVETMRTELHRRRSRLVSLKEIHDKYEGFARGTRAVMQEAGQLADGERGQKIWGLVADVVEAPEKLELAVEAALGDRLGGILISDHDVGARAIEYLKETSGGRTSFVAYGKSENRGGIQFEDRSEALAGMPAAGARGPMPSGEGVLGPMTQLVSFDPGFDTVGRQLLDGCVVVDSLDRAIDLHKGGNLHTLVTLDGDVVEPRGVISGGSRDSQGAGVLAQKREIRQLEEIVAELEQDLTNATARYVATKQELSRVTRTLDSLRSERHEGEIAITSNEKDLGRVRSEHDRARQRATQLNVEQLELEERLRELAEDETATRELAARAANQIADNETAQLEQAEIVADGRVRVEELSQALTELKVRMAQLGEKRASVAARAMQLEMADRELVDRIGKLRASIEEGGARAEILRADSETLSTELVELRKDHAEKAEALSTGRGIYETRLGELQIAEVTVRELRARAEHLGGDVNAFELKRQGVGTNRQLLEEGIMERYRVSLRRELGDFHLRPLPGVEEDKRLAQLKSLIDRMGADINLTAIEEFKEVSERHEFLSTQQVDLENAVGQLERAINKINKTSRKLFRDTYDAINAKFQEVYPRLFRGGRASLSLVYPDGNQDILEAGVEIMAQPPGKKNSTVEQLSGGEKALTAVALIFAIFLIKPSPFCLLDEVDAPLDDTNVDRYNEIVRQMTDRSQFIIITHNKRTMEIADHLYGVTMQEPGVSKLVSVNLSKVAAQAA